MVAVGTGWGFGLGCEIEVILCTGISFTAVVGDIKSDNHTDCTNRFTAVNGCVVEFIICVNTINPMVRRTGDLSSIGFDGYVVSINKLKEC